jgi:hypothetical protein
MTLKKHISSKESATDTSVRLNQELSSYVFEAIGQPPEYV